MSTATPAPTTAGPGAPCAATSNASAPEANDRAIEGLGTSEAQWLGWPGLWQLPAITADALVPSGARAVIIAPHPDDEVLATGGLLALCARIGRAVTVVAVTDGTASHAGSTLWPAQRLARERPQETRAALDALGIAAQPLRLRIGDGEVSAAEAELADRLTTLLGAGDVLFTTWRGDGHPDHEATGNACATAAQRSGATLVEAPVWAWHWAAPADARLPWSRARRLALDDDAAQRKRAAVQAFVSQLEPDPSTGAGPILRSTTLERAARAFEVVFV